MHKSGRKIMIYYEFSTRVGRWKSLRNGELPNVISLCQTTIVVAKTWTEMLVICL